MGKGLFVAGTDTGVGKTFITGGLAAHYSNHGVDVGVMKPVESGCKRSGGNLIPHDALFLKEMASAADDLDLIVPYRLEHPLTPSIAAELEGVTINLAGVGDIYRVLESRHELVMVEGAGGVLAPLWGKYTAVHLIRLLGVPMVVVARNALGTINHTLLTVEHARHCGLTVLGIIINTCTPHPDSSAVTNPEIIGRLSGIPLLGTVSYCFTSGVSRSELAALIGEQVNTDRLRALL